MFYTKKKIAGIKDKHFNVAEMKIIKKKSKTK